MQNANSVHTLVAVELKLSKDDDLELIDPTLFRSLVGSLMYLTATRPDIAYGISLINRYMESPRKSHWEAGKWILRYIQGTRSEGIFYKQVHNPRLFGYCDSDWAGDHDDSKSTSENIFFVESSAISWMSKKKVVVVLSKL